MSTPERDEELEAYLERRTQLQRRLSELDDLQPPARLDHLVLARAREALEAPQGLPLFRGTRWALPFTLTATLVLTVAVVTSLHAIRDVHTSAPSATSAASNPTPAAAPMRAEPARVRSGDARARAPERDPAQWLARIRELRAAGKEHEAQRESAAFRAAYPDYPDRGASP
jgi:hypothetical protein